MVSADVPARRLNVAALGAGWAVFVIANAQRIDVVPFFGRLRSYYHVDYTGAGGLLSAYLLGYVMAQVPMGLAADNLPTRRVTLTGLALMTVTSGLFALTHQYWLAMLLRFLMGISAAALYSSTVKQLLGVAPSRGTAMGLLQSGAGTGVVVGLLGLPLLDQVIGLWPAFLALTAATAVTDVYAAACLPPVGQRGPAAGTMAQQVGGIVRDRYFRYIASCNALALFSVYGITAWVPTYLQTEFRFSGAAAGGVAALINVGLAVASPATGALSDRLGVRGPVVIAGVGTLVLAFALLVGVPSPAGVIASAVIAGLGIALTLPILTTMTTDVFGVRRAGVAISLNLAVSQVASTISGVLFGFLLDATRSFHLVWSVGLAVAVVGLVPAALLRAREAAGAVAGAQG
ncbi:MAG TPA: MFS transporter [bacterium]|nr:MFS transporter [bacterium]